MTALYESPLGWINIRATEEYITSVRFNDTGYSVETELTPILSDCLQQLNEYFEHKRKSFDLPLRLTGTPFQKTVWEELMKVPFGTVVSYGEIAKRIGNKNAVRAVGTANNKNPVVIIVPCHRIIGANGKLIGYGGGVWRKEWLLEHEKSLLF
ncbi:cysteine methyltransferase [candidate division KSB1 bacterium 4572_119]|nr:MAG: cysteine methyltransferase [candidate division KSB1 bacterium 4572_119]